MATKKPARRVATAEPAAAAPPTDTVSQPAAPAVAEAAPAEAVVTAVVEPSTPGKVKDQKAKGKDKKKKDKKKKNKEAVMIRFEKDQLGLIDTRADALGLSRAAWVRMVVAQALAQA